MNLSKRKIIVSATLVLLIVVVFAMGFTNGSSEVFLSGLKPTAKQDKITNREVYLGGQPIGVEVRSNGLLVENILPVVTKDGVHTPLADCDIKS